MKFIKTADWQPGIEAITKRLQQELAAGKRTLWFTTGGTNIKYSKQIMDQLADELTKNLTVTLTDERYGAVGHADSNWQQLLASGFDFKQATPLPVLTGDLPLEATREAWDTSLTAAIDASEAIIGQFGMGPDGHICGIKPDSPAVGIEDATAAYIWNDFTRITTTFTTVKKCTAAYLLTYGADRRPALEKLQTTVSLSEEPTQILKQLPEAYVYNDQIGGE